MRAWRVHELGHPSTSMRLEDIEVPAPGPGQVLVETIACGICGGVFGAAFSRLTLALTRRLRRWKHAPMRKIAAIAGVAAAKRQ